MVTSENEFKLFNASVVFGWFEWDVGFCDTAEKFDKGLFEIFNPQITNEIVTANINLRHSFDINCGSMRYNKQLFPNLFL